jgi:hypothetical protein
MSDVQDARSALDRADEAAIAGDLASADQLLRAALRLQEAELGPYHPDLASTLSNLGIVAEKTGRPNDAEAFYRRAVAIASASLPPDHTMVVESRRNLEGFCRERGLPIEAAVVAESSEAAADRPTAFTEPSVPHPSTTPDVVHRMASPRRVPPRQLAPAVMGIVVLLVITVLVMRRTSPPPETPETAPIAEPATQPPIEPPQQPAAPSTRMEEPPPPKAASPSAALRAAPRITLATAELCGTFFASGANWRCDPVDGAVAPRRLVLYTRVKSPRDTAVVHRWYRGQALRQSAKLAVRANTNEGYRTFSRLTVDGGDWRVEVRSADGDMLYEQRFTVR